MSDIKQTYTLLVEMELYHIFPLEGVDESLTLETLKAEGTSQKRNDQ